MSKSALSRTRAPIGGTSRPGRVGWLVGHRVRRVPTSSDGRGDPAEFYDSLRRHQDVEHIGDDLGPAVDEVPPAVLYNQVLVVLLPLSLVEELERPPIVEIPDQPTFW